MLIRPSIRRDHVISTWKRFSCKFYCSACSLPTTPALFIKLLVLYSDCFVDNEPFLWLLWSSDWSQIGKNRFWRFDGLQWRVFFGLTWDLMHFVAKILYVICKNVTCLVSSGMWYCVFWHKLCDGPRKRVVSSFRQEEIFWCKISPEYTASHLTATRS